MQRYIALFGLISLTTCMEKQRFASVFHPWSFLLAFGVGMLFVYLTAPVPTVIVRYPTPFNAGRITYRDARGTCYRYRSHKTTCNAQTPIQRVEFVDAASASAPSTLSSTPFFGFFSPSTPPSRPNSATVPVAAFPFSASATDSSSKR